MEYELRIVVEKVAVSSQQVVNRDTLKIYDVKAPASILELGLRHEEQISVKKVQNSVLAAQSKLIDTGYAFVQSVATSSIKDTRNLIFTLCLRIIKSGYRNINAVILSVIGKVLPQQPLCSAPLFILIWLSCNASRGLV